MPPRAKKPVDNPNSWWDSAYANHPDIEAEFELKHGNDTLVPGTKFRIKHKRGEFKFRCFATNTRTGATWIDCIEIDSCFRSFRVDQIKGVVKPRRARRRKATT